MALFLMSHNVSDIFIRHINIDIKKNRDNDSKIKLTSSLQNVLSKIFRK